MVIITRQSHYDTKFPYCCLLRGWHAQPLVEQVGKAEQKAKYNKSEAIKSLSLYLLVVQVQSQLMDFA